MKKKCYKIAVIVPKYGLVGGGERFVMELTERIAYQPQYEVHVFANQWQKISKRVIFHKVPIIRFPKFLAPISFAYHARKQISEMNFDLVHSHERVFDADIVTLHSVPHRFWVKHIRKKMLMSLFDLATEYVEQCMIRSGCRYFLPVSELTYQKFSEQYRIDDSQVQVIHPGVDIHLFKPIHPKLRENIRRKFGISDSELIAIFVGMNFEVKGLDAILHALSAADIPNLKLLVVGKGNIGKYERLARKLKIEDRILFTGVMQKGVESLYSSSDMFVMLSKFDTFGMVVSEAMASGLPVIVSPCVGAKDWVKDGENGFVVDPGDIGAVASRLKILADDRQRQKMGQAAYHTVRDRTWNNMANQVLEIYESALSSLVIKKSASPTYDMPPILNECLIASE